MGNKTLPFVDKWLKYINSFEIVFINLGPFLNDI